MNNPEIYVSIIDFIGIIISTVLSIINTYIELFIFFSNKKEGDESKISVVMINVNPTFIKTEIIKVDYKSTKD